MLLSHGASSFPKKSKERKEALGAAMDVLSSPSERCVLAKATSEKTHELSVRWLTETEF